MIKNQKDNVMTNWIYSKLDFVLNINTNSNSQCPYKTFISK